MGPKLGYNQEPTRSSHQDIRMLHTTLREETGSISPLIIEQNQKSGSACTTRTAAKTTDNRIVYLEPGQECDEVSNYVWQDYDGSFKKPEKVLNVTNIDLSLANSYSAQENRTVVARSHRKADQQLEIFSKPTTE
uniref:Uncharacterized protein n=1 Tax=Caenorhabditis japonica TaxID=281687 RepID=A0A8R1IT73_CAEJA